MLGKWFAQWLCCFALLFTGHVPAKQAEQSLYILGVVQDAGFPQIGCYQAHCLPAWQDKRLQRGAVSIALIDQKEKTKYLFEASPNLPQQLYQLSTIAPDPDYQLAGIFLTHAHIGHYAGLMYLGHEAMGANNVPVYAMPRMKQFLENNGPWDQLSRYNNIQLKPLADKQPVSLAQVSVTPFTVPHRDEYSETVGYRIQGQHKTAIFIPDINKWQSWKTNIADLVKTVDYAFLDAAFYADGELPGRDMSKIPHPFVSESMQIFDALPIQQRNKIWFIHMNHTNPLLNKNSPEAKLVQSKGYHIAQEGLSFDL
jgi:pyrroloquinoline quinone biosynthesis protein B